uniref:G domain-containing protein n=1 Tax=Panagrolaimus davidi TaxID=227884 RepID=A0A914Q3Z4_9BILA
MQIIDDLKVSSSPTSIGIIGLPKTGRSTLIGALMGGIWPETLNENPVITINKIPIYKLSYPNNGFIQGSVNENREIYQNYFINSQLLNLSALVICISENVREEDLLVFSIASDYHIPTIIARTKLDQWLHNLPQNKTKNDYIEGDKKYVSCEFRELGLNISSSIIFNVSALSSIKIAEGSGTHMMKYLCDDKKLREYLKLENENVRENEAMSSVDVLVLGLNRAGKSAIIDGLKSKFANISFGEQNYDETMSVDTVIW